MENEVTDVNSALRMYNAIEDRRDQLRTKYDKQEGVLKDAQARVEEFLMSEMKRLGLTACEVPGEGVAAIKVKRRFGCADWGLFWQWVVEQKCPNFLQKRLLDSEIQTYLEATGELPPAVNSEAKQVISVTKRPPK